MFFEYEKNDSVEEFKENYYKEIEDLTNEEKKQFNLELRRLLFDSFIDGTSNIDDQIVPFLKEDLRMNIENTNLSCLSIKKSLKKFELMLEKGKIDATLEKQADIIIDQYMENNYEIEPLYKIKDLLKKRMHNVSKEEIVERKLLKSLISKFEIILIKYKETRVKKQNNLFFVVEYFLNREDSYLYLKRIIDMLPSIINMKVMTYDEVPVIEYILDKFIENYRKMILNKNDEYISKDYLKEVYMLFYNDYHLFLTKDEMKKIDNKLLAFVTEMNKYLTSSKRKNAIKYDIKDMYMFKKYLEHKNDLYECYSDTYIDSELNNIDIHLKNYMDKTDRIDLSSDYAITIDNSYHAYSIENRKRKKILKVHVVDLYGAIFTKSLTNYLLTSTLKSEIDHYMKGKFEFKKDRTYPCFTFELTIPGNDIKIYKSKVKIKNNFNDCDKDNPNIKFYEDIVDSDKSLDEALIDIVNDRLVKFINDKKLPFIYSGVRNYDEKDLNEVCKDLSPIMSKLSHQEFNQIYKIIKEHKDEFHYETEYFEGASLNIFDNLSYVNLLIQKMISEYLDKDDFNKAKIKYQKKINNLVDKLNYYSNYVDNNLIIKNKGKIIKQKKIEL